HDAAASEIAVDARSRKEHHPPLGLHAAVHLAFDVGVAHVHVDAHGAVRTYLEPVAVEEITVEFPFDAQRSLHHEGAAQGRAHADDRVGSCLLDGGGLLSLSEKFHGLLPTATGTTTARRSFRAAARAPAG